MAQVRVSLAISASDVSTAYQSLSKALQMYLSRRAAPLPGGKTHLRFGLVPKRRSRFATTFAAVAKNSGSDEKRMRLRYAGTCRGCGAALPANAEAIYEWLRRWDHH
jgi:hypothetical protein